MRITLTVVFEFFLFDAINFSIPCDQMQTLRVKIDESGFVRPSQPPLEEYVVVH